MDLKIKSICPVQQSDSKCVHHGEWRIRVRTNNGRELFHGIGAGYNLAQAEWYIDNLSRDVARHGTSAAL